jgi:KDO2-lipid IV(A) lauroyltransferase
MMSFILYKLGEFITCSLPLRAAYAVAVFISDFRFIYAREDRRNVLANLKVIFPEKSEAQIRAIRRKMFRNFAKYLVDFFRFVKMDRTFIHQKIKTEGTEAFDRALKEKKGVVVLTAHIGNWELGGVVIALLGYPLWVVALPHKNKKVNDFFDGRRKGKNINVIPFGKAARQCLQTLRENKMVALLGDRDFSHERGLITELFGRPIYLPKGPAALALKTGAAIVPGFMIRNPDDTFTLKIEPAVNIAVTGDSEKDLEEAVNRYKDILEDYIRRYPEQWFMFRKFWIE